MLLQQKSQLACAAVEKDPDHTVYPALQQRANRFFFALGQPIGVVHHQIVPVAVNHILDTPHKGWVERVGDIGDHTADRESLAGAQAARSPVGHIAKLLHGVQHALPGLVGHCDLCALVEHVGNHCLRDPSGSCHIRLGRPPAGYLFIHRPAPSRQPFVETASLYV
jgi:hypothetical protein